MNKTESIVKEKFFKIIYKENSKIIRRANKLIKELEVKSSMSEKLKCRNCGSENVSAWSRIVGYFSNLASWGKGKKEELKARRKGNYKV